MGTLQEVIDKMAGVQSMMPPAIDKKDTEDPRDWTKPSKAPFQGSSLKLLLSLTQIRRTRTFSYKDDPSNP